MNPEIKQKVEGVLHLFSIVLWDSKMEYYFSFHAGFIFLTDIFINFLISWWCQLVFCFFVILWEFCFWFLSHCICADAIWKSFRAVNACKCAFSNDLVLLLWISCNQLQWCSCSFRILQNLFIGCLSMLILLNLPFSLLEPLFALLKELLVMLACHADSATLKGVLHQGQLEEFC